MSSRPYSSPVRDAAAAAKRARVVDVAGRLLRERENIASVSMDAVAKAAGVTRLTVYKQFGSRRGLLEAVFDEAARQGGLGRIAAVMAVDDPRAALGRLIEIFCEFWGSDPSRGRLHDAAALDPEFAQTLAERNERRRAAIGLLIDRFTAGSIGPALKANDVVDLLFGLTSFAMYRSLAANRPQQAVCALLKAACAAIIDSMALKSG
jgi:AcrR family transcriptional regulator